MPKKYPSQGARLLTFLMSRGGSATVNEIRRHTNDGRLLELARPELGDLIAEEKSRSATPKRRKRACRRVSLTLAGGAAAKALQPDWQPRRLATPILREWFQGLVHEHDGWAYPLARAAEEGREYAGIKKDLKRFQVWRARRDRLNARRQAREQSKAAAARRAADAAHNLARQQAEATRIAEAKRADELARRTACPICGSDTRLGQPFTLHPTTEDCRRMLAMLK
jgi:hypothetical protein